MGIPSRRRLAVPGLGIARFPHGKRAETTVLQVGPHFVEEDLNPLPVLYGAGGLPVHSGRAGALVSSHPSPRDQQERGIGNEIEQVIEPAITIVGRPTVQLGLHLQYPALGLEQRELQRVGIHQRPPGIAASSLLSCWPPSPCTELSSARTTTGPPPHLRTSAGNGPALDLRTGCPESGGDRRRFPRSPCADRPGRRPATTPAASPRLRRRPSAWPPHRQLETGFGVDHPCRSERSRTAPRAHIRQI